MIKFNKGVVIWPNMFKFLICFIRLAEVFFDLDDFFLLFASECADELLGSSGSLVAKV
jgi:hypothetical protein